MRIARVVLICTALYLPAAQAQPNAALGAVMKERKLSPDLLKGVEQELAVPAAWLEAARKERKFRLTMTMEDASFEKVRKVFNARYPFIEVEYTRGLGARRAMQPLLAFRRGTLITDVVTSYEVMKDEYKGVKALLGATDLPVLKSLNPAYYDADGMSITYRLTNYCMAYAVNRVKKEELPKTWDELLANPRWRNGRVGISELANVWLVQIVGLRGDAWGRDFVHKLFTEVRPQTRKENLNTIGRLAALGEFDIAIPSSDANTFENAKAGVAVGYHCPDTVSVSSANVGIFSTTPSPHAAKIFVNWLMSREGQIAINYADAMTPAHPGLAVREMLFYPEELKGRKMALPDDKVEKLTPKFMEMWHSYWLKSGGTKIGDDKGAKKGPR